jgi:ubiquinone/menaquinone biosynthesis C-methylase UbiE
MTQATPAPRPICDYEGSTYKEDFWGSQDRAYEDLAERLALRRLLPARGRRLIEIGAGFGRLAALYAGYDEVVLFDYSRSLLTQARQQLGSDRRFTFVAGDLYELPFTDGYFDAVVMIRVLHHLVDVPAALRQARRVLAGDGRFILEFANKRNIKSILRYLLRRQTWSPFDHQPYEFVTLNFNFHPAWIAQQTRAAGLYTERAYALSYFRLAPLKRAVPAGWLARLDSLLQPRGRFLACSPSVILRLRHAASPAPSAPAGRFRCLACGQGALLEQEDRLICAGCGQTWPIHDGIYDFKRTNEA